MQAREWLGPFSAAVYIGPDEQAGPATRQVWKRDRADAATPAWRRWGCR